MISIFIDPNAGAPNQMSRRIPPSVPTAAHGFASGTPRAAGDRELNESFWCEWLIETLDLEGQPMLITRLVNSAASWSTFTNRSERELKKIELFRLIGKLIRAGRLQRVARKFVTLPAEGKKGPAEPPKVTPLIGLPPPSI
jgi:hypothetical protein